MLDSSTWGLIAAIIGITVAYFLIILAVMWVVRKVCARLAAIKRLQPALNACRRLGRFFKFTHAPMPDAEPISNQSQHKPKQQLAFLLVMILACLGLAFGVYKFFDVWLHKSAENRGRHAFAALYAVATRQAVGDVKPDDEIGMEELRKHPLVRVDRIKDDGRVQEITCGHLLEEQAGRLLLLNARGSTMLNFGDSAYSWREVETGQCVDASNSVQEAGPPRTAAAAASATSATSTAAPASAVASAAKR